MSRKLVESLLGPRWIRIRIQSPPHNALTPELCLQLSQVLQAAAGNPEIRAILLDAQGPNFCVGADLKWARSSGEGALGTLVRAMNPVCEIMMCAPKPVICAVNGVAAGGGMAIALAADVRIASLRSRFRLAYPQVALSLDGGLSLRLPQLVGLGKAQSLLFEDRPWSASEARDLGMVHEVVHPDRFEERALQTLEQLASGPTLAWGESKRLLNPVEKIREVLEREAEAITRLSQSQDARRAVEAFLEKGTPVYEGR